MNECSNIKYAMQMVASYLTFAILILTGFPCILVYALGLFSWLFRLHSLILLTSCNTHNEVISPRRRRNAIHGVCINAQCWPGSLSPPFTHGHVLRITDTTCNTKERNIRILVFGESRIFFASLFRRSKGCKGESIKFALFCISFSRFNNACMDNTI